MPLDCGPLLPPDPTNEIYLGTAAAAVHADKSMLLTEGRNAARTRPPGRVLFTMNPETENTIHGDRISTFYMSIKHIDK
jgi:hypothetical protein